MYQRYDRLEANETYCHGLVRTSRLHLIIGTLSLLTPGAFEGVRLGLRNHKISIDRTNWSQ